MLHEERHTQINFVFEARLKYPNLKTIVCPIVYYGGSTGAKINQGKVQKAMGYMKGTLDMLLPHPRGCFHGLFLEFKREEGGKISPDQKLMATDHAKEGYCVAFCKTVEAAIKVLDLYMDGKIPQGWDIFESDGLTANRVIWEVPDDTLKQRHTRRKRGNSMGL